MPHPREPHLDPHRDERPPSWEQAPGARRFVGPDGGQWVAAEVSAPADLRRIRSGRCLMFSTETAWRRVYEYPTAWRTLDVAALWELSWRQ